MQSMLRPFTKEDAESFAFYANNVQIAKNLRDVFPNPYTKEDALGYIQSIIDAGTNQQITYAIVVDGKAVGSIGVFVRADVYRKTAEIGYWLGEPYWGKGIMTDAVKQITKEAFERFDLERIFAEIFAYNEGSKRVLEKAGYTCEGILRNGVFKQGKVYDSCMYSVLKNEAETIA